MAPSIYGKIESVIQLVIRFRLDAKLVYVLMRPKRTQTCADRLEKILRQPIFDELLQTKPNLRNRIRILNGTLAAHNLDISNPNELSDLIASTEIVIHSAANVNFDATLHEVIGTNVYGTSQLLQLCVRMQKMTAFLYVSTAYSQIHLDAPAEQFYEPIVDPMLLIACFQRFGANCTDEIDKTAFEAIVMKLIAQPRMIPYMLSKNAAEVLVQSYGDRLPIAVIRPSVGECHIYGVSASRLQPEPIALIFILRFQLFARGEIQYQAGCKAFKHRIY